MVNGRVQYWGPEFNNLINGLDDGIVSVAAGSMYHTTYPSTLSAVSGSPFAVMQIVLQMCDPEHVISSLLSQLFPAWL